MIYRAYAMTRLWPPTDDDPHHGQDPNTMYSSNHLSMIHHPSGGSINYINGSGNAQYSTSCSSFAQPYQTQYMPPHNPTGQLMYMPGTLNLTMPYSVEPPSTGTLQSQPRTMQHHSMQLSSMNGNRTSYQQSRPQIAPEIILADTEDQDSLNQDSTRSEPVIPEIAGYPNVDAFDEVMQEYVTNLSPKKQDKALIHAKRAANIKMVLLDKKQTQIESAQFRFWVKKMFTLEPRNGPPERKKICHENKPVAIREKLFKILIRAHKACSHGGRDKTSSQVRRTYSWVPKELISRFVKLCPTCQNRRGTSRTTPPSSSEADSAPFMSPTSPQMQCLNQQQQQHRYSISSQAASLIQSPIQASGFSATFQAQNRWMTDLQDVEKSNSSDRIDTLDAAASAMVSMNMESPASSGNYVSTPSKFTNDVGTPYMPPTSAGMHINTMPPQYHHHHHQGYSDLPRPNPYYQSKHGAMFKQEQY